MKFHEFEHVYLPRILLPLLGGLFVICALQTAARAETGVLALGADSYVVKADEGYGVNDCIRGGDDCAKVVADAWCEAHGHGDAKAFGLRAREYHRLDREILGQIRRPAAYFGRRRVHNLQRMNCSKSPGLSRQLIY